ncbi:MAG: hypothetical protein QFB87_04555 [Patescibacteria group bacterium]|nr:hypothetical protein [Patescibacteria group bacterium]
MAETARNAYATTGANAAAGTPNVVAVFADSIADRQLMIPSGGDAGNYSATLTAWNSATALNATQNIFTTGGSPATLVQLTQTSTITGGAITFEVTYDNSTWVTITPSQVVDPTSANFTTISLPYTLVASTNKQFLVLNNGWQGLRIKLSTAIVGSATVTPNYTLLPYDPLTSTVSYAPVTTSYFAPAQLATVTAMKTTATKLYDVNVYNPNSVIAYWQLFDLATGSVTLGTTTPKKSFPIPPNGYLDKSLVSPIVFNTAASHACTTTATGLTAPATGLVINTEVI